MLAAFLLTIAGVLLLLGATLASFAKSGEQETLGGVIIMIGAVILMGGGLCLWVGA